MPLKLYRSFLCSFMEVTTKKPQHSIPKSRFMFYGSTNFMKLYRSFETFYSLLENLYLCGRPDLMS